MSDLKQIPQEEIKAAFLNEYMADPDNIDYDGEQWCIFEVGYIAGRRTQPEAAAPAPIPGMPFADMATPIKEFEARKAAALASSANALIAGDRVDAAHALLKKIRSDLFKARCQGSSLESYRNAVTFAEADIAEFLQSQNGGSHGAR